MYSRAPEHVGRADVRQLRSEPYKFVYLTETDFKEKPWYPTGTRNRGLFELDQLNEDQRKGL